MADLTVREAGRKGGQATLRKRGRGHYVHIGKKGQAILRKKYPGMARVWGMTGGRPRKKNLAEIEEETGKSKNGGSFAGSLKHIPVSSTNSIDKNDTRVKKRTLISHRTRGKT